MKKLILLLLIVYGSNPFVSARDGRNQHLSPEEFRVKQKEVIKETAQLTDKEADNFFPLYFELQDRKREMNNKMWQDIRLDRGKEISEEQYGKMMQVISDTRINLAQLENEYLTKFRKVLSNKKIFLVQRAELRFQREILKGMHRGGQPPGNQKAKRPQ
ncbi:MAG: hypothetical protein LBL97_00395 [Prevotellaceae bacterium]|jgi:hypothetical protein|nr:hypothetical protein [Prevotellaceae bacterium]